MSIMSYLTENRIVEKAKQHPETFEIKQNVTYESDTLKVFEVGIRLKNSFVWYWFDGMDAKDGTEPNINLERGYSQNTGQIKSGVKFRIKAKEMFSRKIEKLEAKKQMA